MRLKHVSLIDFHNANCDVMKTEEIEHTLKLSACGKLIW